MTGCGKTLPALAHAPMIATGSRAFQVVQQAILEVLARDRVRTRLPALPCIQVALEVLARDRVRLTTVPGPSCTQASAVPPGRSAAGACKHASFA